MEQEFLSYHEDKLTISKVTLYLDEEIIEPSYYRQVLHRIHSLTEDDEVDVIVNTDGGRYDSSVSIINALRYTPATVTGILNNKAYSAGSLILLACPNIHIAEGSTMLCHNYTSGAEDKGSALVDNVLFNNEQIKKFTSEIYSGFLTPKELNSMFADKDFWFGADEIKERLLSRQKYLLKLQKQSETKAKPKVTPKPKQAKVVPPPEYNPKDVAFSKT